MVVPQEEDEKKLVYDLKFSSVVPGRVLGENKSQDLKPIDLAMKLHYLKGLYLFPNNKHSPLSIDELKLPMFDWLVSYFMTCGRIRRLSSDPDCEPRTVIKLNDAGIRIVEARSSKTVHECLAMEDFFSVQDQLIYSHALGPDLGFSPLVYIQFTWFKCGGISVGLSWAHILGDVFSASTFMNNLGQQGPKAQILVSPVHPKPEYPLRSPSQEPLSLKRVNPVDDHWVAAPNCKMVTHFFSFSSTKLDQMLSRVHIPKVGEERMGKHFEVISAIMWKIIAKIRNGLEPRIVTIFRPRSLNRGQVVPYNGQVIATPKVDFSPSEANVLELLSSLVNENTVDESDMVEETIEGDKGMLDYIIYGANLTFVDMEDANIYGFKVNGEYPMFASYTIGGVGEAGSVLVLPGAKDCEDGDNSGKLMVVTLPEYELDEVKIELKNQWCVV